jgi:cytochrome c5
MCASRIYRKLYFTAVILRCLEFPPVSASHDRKFFDTFMLVLGILAAVTIGLMVLAGIISDRTAKKFHELDPLKQEETLDRIAPVARVAIAGQDNSSLEPPPATPDAPATDLPGDQVYQQVCAACHGAGVAGAPKTGDKAAWAPRVAQGADTLHKHAIEGYQGKAGFMPPKGGRTDLTDQSVVNAVDHMVKQSQ